MPRLSYQVYLSVYLRRKAMNLSTDSQLKANQDKAMKSLFVIVIMLSCLAGCGSASSLSQDGGVPHSYYTLLIDPSFTQNEYDDIANAVLSWEQAVPVHFDIAYGISICPTDGVVCISPNTSSQAFEISEAGTDIPDDAGPYHLLGWTEWYFQDGEAQISIDQRASVIGDKLFQATAAHELGHSMGLIHHEGCYLMNAVMTECAVIPTVNDVNQWFDLRI